MNHHIVHFPEIFRNIVFIPKYIEWKARFIERLTIFNKLIFPNFNLFETLLISKVKNDHTAMWVFIEDLRKWVIFIRTCCILQLSNYPRNPYNTSIFSSLQWDVFYEEFVPNSLISILVGTILGESSHKK